MSQTEDAILMIPYCNRYLEHGEFPDGLGMAQQPKVLVDLLSIFVNYFRQYEKEDFEARIKQK